jgi:hypothetical protein
MANMLLMSAFDVCNPVEKFILMKPTILRGIPGTLARIGFIYGSILLYVRCRLAVQSAPIHRRPTLTYFSSIYCFHHTYATNARLTAATIVRIKR